MSPASGRSPNSQMLVGSGWGYVWGRSQIQICSDLATCQTALQLLQADMHTHVDSCAHAFLPESSPTVAASPCEELPAVATQAVWQKWQKWQYAPVLWPAASSAAAGGSVTSVVTRVPSGSASCPCGTMQQGAALLWPDEIRI